MSKRQLILEDGSVFKGEGFGSERQVSGEVIFNTAMTGYQEALSDPAYFGQIIMMTYPLVGNYGINRDDFEGVTPFVNGIVVKEVCDAPSNFRSDETLDHYLKAHDIPGISGIDTRMLMRLIRVNGTMKGHIANMEQSPKVIVDKLQNSVEEKDQVKQTSTLRPYVVPGRGQRIVLVDFGMKHGVLRELTKRSCHVTVVPYNYNSEQILRLKPDGIIFSSGPGNPEHLTDAIQVVQDLINKLPIFGIGLGQQIFALACGAKVEKMKFGHHGVNYPVKDLDIDKTFITSLNHEYTVSKSSLEKIPLHISQIVLNDNTIAGLKHKTRPAFSVQYYPESSPGPEDTSHLFDQFLHMVENEVNDKEQINV